MNGPGYRWRGSSAVIRRRRYLVGEEQGSTNVGECDDPFHIHYTITLSPLHHYTLLSTEVAVSSPCHIIWSWHTWVTTDNQ